MTGGITKGQIAAGCIGLALLLGIGYWTFLRTDDSNRKKRSKSKKKLQKEAATKKSKKTTKRKYSDSDSNSSSLPEISDESVLRDFSDSESDSIEVAQRNRKKSKKSKSRSGKNRKSPNKLKIEVLEPKVAEVIPPLNTKRHSPLKVESVLFEKKKKEDQETLAGARS